MTSTENAILLQNHANALDVGLVSTESAGEQAIR